MMNLFKAWNNFWFRPQNVTNLGLFRIVVGLLALTKLLLLLPVLEDYFSEVGMFQLRHSQHFVAAPRLCLFDFLPLDSAFVFFIVTIIISVCFTLGIFTKPMTIALYIAMVSIEYRNPLIFNSGDRLMIIMLFFGIFAPLGQTLSLDSLWARRKGLLKEDYQWGSFWAGRLMQLQFLLMYFMSFYLKCQNQLWASGEATYWTTRNIERARLPLPSFLTDNMWGIHFLTYFTLAAELIIPFAIWSKRLKPFVIALGIALHLGIEWHMNVAVFQFMAISCYILFFTGEEITQGWKKFCAILREADQRLGVYLK